MRLTHSFMCHLQQKKKKIVEWKDFATRTSFPLIQQTFVSFFIDGHILCQQLLSEILSEKFCLKQKNNTTDPIYRLQFP